MSARLRKIVLFHEHLVNPGGAERFFVEEYKFLKSRGIQTYPLTFAPHQPQALYGTAIPELEVLHRRHLWNGILTLRRRLLELGPDLVITGGGVRDLFLATRGIHLPYVLHQHEPPYKRIGFRRPALFRRLRHRAVEEIRHRRLYQYQHQRSLGRAVPSRSLAHRFEVEVGAFLDAWCVQAAHQVTVLSHQAADEVKQLYGRDSLVARGAVRADFLERTLAPEQPPAHLFGDGGDGEAIILSISRLHASKRIDMIIRAFGEVLRDHPDTRLVIGGVGPEEGALKQLTGDLGLAAAVTFAGFVPDEALKGYYAASKVFVLADWTDFDITPYEALALRCTVVGSAEMEIEPQLVASGWVMQAEPVAPAYAQAIRRALAAVPPAAPDLHSLTWDNLFTRVLAALERQPARNEGRKA